ncbi:hypothetical protein L3Q82_015341 [Scortum barcoo]|uniref:Uncharacterized protein n=1 Tax=Scortum barcoo TaxID=214431 RepID=A0ACB8VTD6_9TELE|nr:hypothetical protein L3Q82_015341 [Scortum barcoo]
MPPWVRMLRLRLVEDEVEADLRSDLSEGKLIPKPQDGGVTWRSSGGAQRSYGAEDQPGVSETMNESVFSSLMRAVITKWTDNYPPIHLLRTIMMSPDDRALEDLLYGSDLGDEAEGGAEAGAELSDGPLGGLEGAAADNSQTPTAISIQQPMTCAGCGEQVCDRFFLLAAGRVWHSVCLRCSQCHCELQMHPMFGGGQCARCFQPIPASALVMRSGELTFHPHCFSCQECDVKLMPGNLYCVQGQNLYCQSHYHEADSTSLPCNIQPKENVKEGAKYRNHPYIFVRDRSESDLRGRGGVSQQSRATIGRQGGGRVWRTDKRIRTCFRSEQLRALESYFAQKHNPDGKDWTCLAHKTGLPKRVLQVWFQNARAKLRRSLTADDSQVNSRPPLLREA